MESRHVKLTGIKATSLAMFEGVFGLILGIGVALMAWLGGTVGYTQSTNSLLQGMILGMGVGLLTLIVVPIIYFVAGWVLGWIHGLVFNLVAGAMGGIEVATASAEPETEAAIEGRPVARRAEPTFGETINGRHRDQ